MIRNRKVYLPLNLVQNPQKLLIVLLAILLALLLGFLIAKPNFSLLNLSLSGGVFLIFLWISQYISLSIFSIEKFFCYLVFFTGFFGGALFAVDIGAFTLFPYRIFLLFLWLIFGLSVLIKGKIVFPQSQIKWFLVFLCFWFGYAVLSLAWAPSKNMAIRYLIFLLMGISVIFFSTYYFRRKADLQKLYLLWIGIFIILLFLGFWEHLTGYHLSVSKLYGETRLMLKFIPTGVFCNQNDYATFLTLSIPFSIALMRYKKNLWLYICGIGISISAFYLIVITGSRSNILAVLFEVAFILTFILNFRRRVRLVVIIVICVILLNVLLPGFLIGFLSNITEQMESIVTQTKFEYGSVSFRVNLVRNGLSLLYSTAGFGVGAGNAEYYLPTNPHNWWLEILINYGIFVFVGYIIFYIGIIQSLWKLYRRKQTIEEKMICEALLVSLVGFFFASISSSSIMAFKPQWLLFAFALSYLNYFRNKEEKICI